MRMSRQDGPGAGRRLLDKDVLAVGRWRVGDREWRVDLAMLRRLVINFQRARDRGIRVPVVWNHSEDARDKIGEVVRLYLSGDVLRARFWTMREADANRLLAMDDQVSVEVVEGWTDGKSRRYDLFLTHLAVVTQPVVHPQGPMRRLSLPMRLVDENSSSGDFLGEMTMMSTMEQEPMKAASTTDEPIVMVTEAVRLVNEIVRLLGVSFQLEMDLEPGKFVDRLEWLRDQIEALVATSTEESAVGSVTQASLSSTALEAPSEEGLPCEMAAALDRMVKEGRLLPAEREEFVQVARRTSLSLSLLKPLERIPLGSAAALQSRRIGRHGASRRGSSDAISPEVMKELLSKYRASG